MEPCCLCNRSRTLVTSQPITELLRKLKKCEQERRRVEAKLQKKYKKIQQREVAKFEVERLRIRCEEVLKPNYKKLTVQLFDDRDVKKKELDKRTKGLESTGSHQRKTERMRKYVAGVKNQFKFERTSSTTMTSQLIDMRLDEAETMLSVTMDEFRTPSLDGMMSTTMHALMGHLATYGGGGAIDEEGERDYEYHYKLVRSQQYLACMNAIRGPRALAPLPAQMPLKVSFKMKLPNMYAGVRLNVDQSNRDRSLDYINQIIDHVETHLPNANALQWVEEDDLIDDQWEELNIHDAAEAAVEARSSYLSSFLTGWTKGAWTTTTPSDASPP